MGILFRRSRAPMLLAALCLLSATFTDALVIGSKLPVTRAIRTSSPMAGLLEELLGGMRKGFDAPVVMGTEEMMSKKAYGTSAVPIQTDLRWGCDVKTADNICNYDRHYAEYSGYWERATIFLAEESKSSGKRNLRILPYHLLILPNPTMPSVPQRTYRILRCRPYLRGADLLRQQHGQAALLRPQEPLMGRLH